MNNTVHHPNLPIILVMIMRMVKIMILLLPSKKIFLQIKDEVMEAFLLDSVVQSDNIWMLHLPAYSGLSLQLLEVWKIISKVGNKDSVGGCQLERGEGGGFLCACLCVLYIAHPLGMSKKEPSLQNFLYGWADDGDHHSDDNDDDDNHDKDHNKDKNNQE